MDLSNKLGWMLRLFLGTGNTYISHPSEVLDYFVSAVFHQLHMRKSLINLLLSYQIYQGEVGWCCCILYLSQAYCLTASQTSLYTWKKRPQAANVIFIDFQYWSLLEAWPIFCPHMAKRVRMVAVSTIYLWYCKEWDIHIGKASLSSHNFKGPPNLENSPKGKLLTKTCSEFDAWLWIHSHLHHPRDFGWDEGYAALCAQWSWRYAQLPGSLEYNYCSG